MSGKKTCAELKKIRKAIADKNGIPLEIEECTFEGECRGTCPSCEAELRELERALDEKKGRGEKIDLKLDIELDKRERGSGDAPIMQSGQHEPPMLGKMIPPDFMLDDMKNANEKMRRLWEERLEGEPCEPEALEGDVLAENRESSKNEELTGHLLPPPFDFELREREKSEKPHKKPLRCKLRKWFSSKK